MKLLLDTHVVLWWLTDDATLADDIKDRIDHDPEVYLSPVTVWEIAVKQAIGKLVEPADLPERIRATRLPEIAITSEHALVAGRLPMHHRDPFDRMLVAQARCEGLALVTRDAHIPIYDVAVVPA